MRKLFCVACVGLIGLQLAATVYANDVIHSTEPLLPTRVVQLEPQWSLGGDDPDLLFGLMVAATSDALGNVYLMDQQLCQVTVVSPEGEVTAVLGRQGEGPGEVRTPQGMALMPDGSVGLAEQFPGKIIKLALDGTPAGTVTVGGSEAETGGFTMAASLASRGGTLVVGALLQAPVDHGQSRKSYLSSLSPTGQELVRFCEHNTILDFEAAHLIEREMVAPFLACYTLGPDGRVYAARSRNDYIIDVYATDGTLEKTLSRDFDLLPRTQKEIDRMDALFEVQDSQLPFRITWEVEKYEQTVTGLHVAQDGTLWVQHARSGYEQPDGILETYDTYDAEGRWIQKVAIQSEGDPAYDGLIFLNDDRVLLVKGLILAQLTASGSQGAVFDEDDTTSTENLEVVCCRVEG